MGYTFKSSDVLDFARSIGADVHQKGNELFFRKCPKCHGGRGDKDTFSVNMENGTFKCFRATCDYHGHFVELARDFDFDLGFGERRVYKKLPQKPFVIRDEAIAYMATRGIGEAVCRKYEITSRKDNKNVIVFPFFDDQGVLRFIKYRNAKFRKGIDKNKEWSEAETMPIPFGMKQCEGFDRLVITEGQIDSLSLAECGIKNAVSVPTGATGFTWVTNCYDWISRFREVIVFGDNENGKITLADGLRSRLTMTIKVVRRKDYLGEKDANDILLKYGKSAVVRAVESAEVPRLENIKDLSTVQSVDLNSLQKIKTNIPTIDKVIGGLIMGQLIVLTGKRGEGKSTFMSQLVCEALEQNETVFIYSGELADYHFKRWLDYQLAGPHNVHGSPNAYGDFEYTLSERAVNAISEWYRGRAYIYDNSWVSEGENELESLTDTIEKAVKQYGIRLVCIDNLMTAMEVVNDGSQLNLAQSNFVGKLKKIAVKYDVAIILVAHPRKSNEAITNDDVSGSSDITNKADIVMSYQRVDNSEDYNGRLSVTKNRLFGKYAVGDKAVPLQYDDATKRIYSAGMENRHYGWEQQIKVVDDDDWMI